MSIHTRPWGYFHILSLGKEYLVKELVIYPGHQISLQKHYNRSERWVVIQGEGSIQIDIDVLPAAPGMTCRIGVEELHRATNTSEHTDLRIIEVQYGKFLREDDIKRVEDDYGRAG